eukprot:s391_g13.t1
MPSSEFTMSKERLLVFRACLKATTTTPEVVEDGDELWKDGWKIIVELLDQAEGMAHSQEHFHDAKNIERFNRIVQKAMSDDMASLPDVCRLATADIDWEGQWPRFVERVGKYHLCQVVEAIPTLQQLRLSWQEQMVPSLPEASWIYIAECQLKAMEKTLNNL